MVSIPKRHINLDPQKETEHLDKHDEMVAQFNYSHSQSNELNNPPQPFQPPAQKQEPHKKHFSLQFGRRSLIILPILITIIVAVYISQSWSAQNGQKFQQDTGNIVTDINAMSVAASKTDVAMVKAKCQQIIRDIAQTRTLAKYPNATIQKKINDGLDKLNSGAQDCIKAADDTDSQLLNKSRDELLTGYDNLKDATTAINGK
jgi:hypothetical protein